MSPVHYIFVAILGLYAAVNVALIIRLYFALRGPGIARPVQLGACLLAILLSLVHPLSRMVEGNDLWVKALTFAGTFWLAFVLHVLLAWGLLGIFRLFNHGFGWLVIAPERRGYWRHVSCVGIIGAALVWSVIGAVNTQYPVVRAIELPAPAGVAPLRIVALSDTHLGRLAPPGFFARVVDLIEPLHPDIVLFAGDIIEYDFDPSDVEATAAVLQRLKPRLGIWGVPGNHEYIGNRGELSQRLLKQIGIRLLVDEGASLPISAAETPPHLLLIGRNDASAERFSGQPRKAIDEIIASVPGAAAAQFKIMLDHQPWHLEQAEAAGVDLQISGHTHNGQLFPFNLLIAALYENGYGHSTRSQTHYWVTSGAGTWGPRVRTTGRAEVLQIDLVGQ